MKTAVDEYASPDRYFYYSMTLQVNRHAVALQCLEGKIMQIIHLPSSQRLAAINPPLSTTLVRVRYQNFYVLLYSSSWLNAQWKRSKHCKRLHESMCILVLSCSSKTDFRGTGSRYVDF